MDHLGLLELLWLVVGIYAAHRTRESSCGTRVLVFIFLSVGTIFYYVGYGIYRATQPGREKKELFYDTPRFDKNDKTKQSDGFSTIEDMKKLADKKK